MATIFLIGRYLGMVQLDSGSLSHVVSPFDAGYSSVSQVRSAAVLLSKGLFLTSLYHKTSPTKFQNDVVSILGRKPRHGDRIFLGGKGRLTPEGRLSQDLLISASLENVWNFEKVLEPAGDVRAYPMPCGPLDFDEKIQKWVIRPRAIRGEPALVSALLEAVASASWAVHFDQKDSFVLAPRNVRPDWGLLFSPLYFPNPILGLSPKEMVEFEAEGQEVTTQLLSIKQFLKIHLMLFGQLRGRRGTQLFITIDHNVCPAGFGMRPFRISKQIPLRFGDTKVPPYILLEHTGMGWETKRKVEVEQEPGLMDLLKFPIWEFAR